MKHEDQDELWALLGEAKEPEVSPFFSRNVLRAIRMEKQESSGVLGWLQVHWQFVCAGAFALSFLSLAAWNQVEQHRQIEFLAEALTSSPDYAVISHLDELIALEENSLWVENSIY